MPMWLQKGLVFTIIGFCAVLASAAITVVLYIFAGWMGIIDHVNRVRYIHKKRIEGAGEDGRSVTISGGSTNEDSDEYSSSEGEKEGTL